MTRSERDELRRAALRFQELTQPHKLIALIERLDELEDQETKKLQNWEHADPAIRIKGTA